MLILQSVDINLEAAAQELRVRQYPDAFYIEKKMHVALSRPTEAAFKLKVYTASFLMNRGLVVFFSGGGSGNHQECYKGLWGPSPGAVLLMFTTLKPCSHQTQFVWQIRPVSMLSKCIVAIRGPVLCFVLQAWRSSGSGEVFSSNYFCPKPTWIVFLLNFMFF